MMLHETNVVDVLSQIASLQNSFSHGVDLITNIFIKRFDRSLAPFLVNYINESFLSGVFPNSLKRATIQPHFKTGSKTDANNYRPISICRLLEKYLKKYENQNSQIHREFQKSWWKSVWFPQSEINSWCTHRCSGKHKVGNRKREQ